MGVFEDMKNEKECFTIFDCHQCKYKSYNHPNTIYGSVFYCERFGKYIKFGYWWEVAQ